MPNSDLNRVNRALETMQQVRNVNALIQGICMRISVSELTDQEAEGLWTILEWQNQNLAAAEGVIKTALGGATLVKVA